MKIDFDSDKTAANPLNHDGVTFDEAKAVLLDPYVLTRENGDTDNEHRFITLGMGAFYIRKTKSGEMYKTNAES